MKSARFALGIITIFCASITCTAQLTQTMYAAAKAGLNIREKPDAASPVLVKVPYGEKVTCLDDGYQGTPIQTEGMSANWYKISYGNFKGYAANVYLFNVPPPQESEKDIKPYLDRIGKAVGNWTYKKYKYETDNMLDIDKTLYDNGIVYTEFSGYESHAESITLPRFDSARGFVMARLLKENWGLITGKDSYPKASVKSTSESGLETMVMKLYPGHWEHKLIYYEKCDGGCASLEIHMDDAGATVTFASWV